MAIVSDRSVLDSLSGAGFAREGIDLRPRPEAPLTPTDLSERLVKRGWSQSAAHGLAANAVHESSLNPGAIGDNGNSYGLFQWNGPRRQELQSFAGARGKDWRDVDTQLDFLDHEVGRDYRGLRERMNAATPDEAARLFTREYERPADLETSLRVRSETARSLSGTRPSVGVAATIAGGSVLPLLMDPAFGAAMRQQNEIASAVSALAPGRFQLDPSFDPIAEAARYPDLEPYVERFAEVRNSDEFAFKAHRIRQELQDKEIIDGAGARGVIYQIAAGAVSPINLIPVAGGAWRATRAANIGLGVARVGGSGLAATTASEALLHATQETRTLEESAWAVGTATVLSGLLGGAAGFVARTSGPAALPRLARRLDDELADVAEAPERRAGGSGGAAAVHDTSLADNPAGDPRVAPPSERLAGGIEGLARRQANLNIVGTPVMRLATSPEVSVRQVSEELIEQSGLARVKHADFITSGPPVEVLRKQWDGRLYVGLRELDGVFGEARTAGVVGRFDRERFNELVGAAMQEGDTGGRLPIPDAMRPFVTRAAQAMRREVFDPLKERAIELGLLPEDVDVKTAVSYLTRVYNQEKISAQRTQFIDVVTGWLGRKRMADEAAAAEAGGRLRQAEDQLRAIVEGAVSEVPDAAALIREGAGLQPQQRTRAMLRALEEESGKTATDMSQTAKGRVQMIGNALRMNRKLTDIEAQELQDLSLRWLGELPGASQDLGAQASRAVSALTDHADALDEAASFARESADLTGTSDAAANRAKARITELRTLVAEAERAANRSTDIMRDLGGKGAAQAESEAWPRFQKLTDDLKKAERRLGQIELANGRLRADASRTVSALADDLVEQAEHIRAVARDFKSATKKSASIRAKATRAMERETLAGLSDQELRDIADQITDQIVGGNPGRTRYEPMQIQLARGPMKERTFNIPDRLIRPWLEMDVEKVARIYTHTMAPDVEIAAKFNGQLDMRDALDRIRRAYDQRIYSAATEDERLALSDRKKQDLADLEAMRDILRGNYKLPSDPSGLAVRAGIIARAINFLRLLGSMAVSAITDIGRPVMVHGMARTIGDGFAPMVRNWHGYRLAANEAKLAGTALDMVLHSRAQSLYDVMDAYGRGSWAERGLGVVTERFGILTLMSAWNASLKQFSGMITQTRTLQAITGLASGKRVAQKEITRLARLGIDEGIAVKIASEFDQHGMKEGGVWWANTADWKARDAASIYRAALAQEVDEIIVTPGAGDKPLWMSTQLGRIVGQFRSFAFASNQRVFLAGLQQRDAATFSGLALMVGLGALRYAIGEWQAGRDVSDDPAVLLQEGVDRSGALGWIFDANNVMEKISRGNIGVSAITGKQGARFASRNEMGAVLGPSFEPAQDLLFEIPSSLTGSGWSEADSRRIRKLFPLQNVFYLRRLFDEMEHAINGALDIPDPRLSERLQNMWP